MWRQSERRTCLQGERTISTWEDEVAQRVISDAESTSGDEIREPLRRNSPSDPTTRETEDHVPTGHASIPSWCAHCVQG